MQLLDADYFLNANKPVIRLYGKAENGNSVCVFYDKFLPYFYVKPNGRTAEGVKKIREIVSSEEVDKFTPLGYQTEPAKLLKITIANPQDVPKVSAALLEEKLADAVYENDIMFKYRFMVDNAIHGMDWIDVNCQRTSTSKVPSPIAAYTASSLKLHEKKENADLRYLAFDIECIPSDTAKPLNSKKDPIVMIAVAFKPAYKSHETLVLVAKPFQGRDVIGFQNEKEMLQEFLNIISIYDPDVLTGYNINSFDLPYLLDRIEQNGLSKFFGRCSDKPVFTKTFGISQDTIIHGRIVADPYQIIKRDPWVKFYRYNLNTVAKAMLNEEKMDVEYREMPGLWKGSREGLNKFIEYSRKDASISLRLVIEKKLLDKFFELAKISGLLLQDTFGGQSMRIETMILHEFRKRNFVMPSKTSSAEMSKREKEREKLGLKGATVLEPRKGLHADGCTLVLDFQSLYPSLMKAHNISPDSLVISGSVKSHTAPTGSKFVDREVYEGIFPFVLSQLLQARDSVKKAMKTAKGDEKRILNAKQLAIKDISNSFYGYTGYSRARLYVIDVANSITAYGRENIEKTKKLIEENFPVEVVYGDTDSLFLKTKITNLDEARKLGEAASKFVSAENQGKLNLQFEKIYRTFLILTKKRYAGWKFVFDNNEWRDEIEMKGIETIRRDWCLTGDTLIQMSNGSLLPIKDIPDKCSVMTINPKTLKIQTDNAIAKIKKTAKILKITTDFTEVKATADHRFFVFSNGAFQFKKAGELKKGDFIVQAKNINIEGKPQELGFNYHDNKNIRKQINIPRLTNKELCQIIGFVFGDGSVAERKVTLYNQDLSLLEFYNKLFSKVFGVTGRLYNGNGCYNMVFFSKTLEMFFRYLGFNSKDKIPDIMHKVPKEQLAAFLRGYFDADGSLSINNKTASKNKSYLVIGLSAKSKRVAEEVKLLLLRFGIWSSNLHLRKSLGTAYEFRLNCENARLFVENIGFTNKKTELRRPPMLKGKAERLPFIEEAKFLIRKTGYSPERFLSDKRAATLTRSTAQSIMNFASSNVVDVDEEFSECFGLLSRTINSDIAFTKIEKIEDGGKDFVYDIDTVKTDTFLANGLLSHNCPLVSETMRKVIDIILKEGDIQKSIASMRTVLESLKKNEVPLDKLTIVKGITKSPENYDGMLPHIELAKKLASRNPHDKPKIGDRLGFVIIKGNQMLSKRAEDPQYVSEHNLQIDSDYYINSQLLPPIERILISIGVTKGELLGSGHQTNFFDLMSGNKRKMKHEISLDYSIKTLEGWENVVCQKCSRSYRRPPLQGVCECGGELLIAYHGSVGRKIVRK